MSETPKIKVLIVDDHMMVRHGLITLFKAFEDLEVIGDTDDGRIALTLCKLYQPDVVLMDLLMPHINGIAATQLIHDQFPQIQIVVLTSTADTALVETALQAGATSYLLKTGSVDEVVDTVRAAYRGKSTLATEAINVLIAPYQLSPHVGFDLTRRERAVLALLVEGLSNREIAAKLVISISTVKNHIMNIYAKLGVRSRTKVVAITIQEQILVKIDD